MAIDPKRHTVYAIVGDSGTRERAHDFVIFWKATDGKNYCAKLSREGDRLGLLDGTLPVGDASPLAGVMARDESLSSMLAALPADSGFGPK